MIEYFYAFVLGMLSILSPCTFIIIPVMLSNATAKLKKIVLFLSGIVTTFSILGVLSALTGKLLTSYIGDYIYLISASITLLMGLNLINVISLEIHSVFTRINSKNDFIIGMLYGGVVLSCIGPLLGAVLVYIVTKATILYGFTMMLSFSLGFIAPFIIFGTIITDKNVQSKLMHHHDIIRKLSGTILILVSTYLFFIGFRGI